MNPTTALSQTSEIPSQSGSIKWGRIIVVAIIALMIVGGISECVDPSAQITDGVATLKETCLYNFTATDIATRIAIDVWALARKHPEVKKIVVELFLNPVLLTDKYGKELKEPLRMGSITIDDVDEVRRYENDGAYARSTKELFAAQVSRMDYAGNLDK
jgi:hypothetical protein